MREEFSRSAMLLGEENIEKLSNARVAVFGVGGVGGYVVEALARSGVGFLDLVDNDKISKSNINRQIIALQSTVGNFKVDVAEQRVKDINPDIVVQTHKIFFMPDTSSQFDFTQYDYVVDAIDTVTGKIELITKCKEHNIKVISAMGAGNKLDATAFEVADIFKTSVCPLARVMRRELKERGISKLKVVYSKEEPHLVKNEEGKKPIPGSSSFVPPIVGLIIAGEVIKDLIQA